MKYGELPVSLGIHECTIEEMFFYQYLPIKLSGDIKPLYEDRLSSFDELVGIICCDYIGVYGLNKYIKTNVYLTVKHLFQLPNCEFNRAGWHSDGFLTDDVNYIWCDNTPTTFNCSDFKLSKDHSKSLLEMENQALQLNNISYSDNELLRLNQYNIHRVTLIKEPCMRTFLKVSFSDEKYNLVGNSHNYLLNYKWDMKPRSIDRNHPVK